MVCVGVSSLCLNSHLVSTLYPRRDVLHNKIVLTITSQQDSPRQWTDFLAARTLLCIVHRRALPHLHRSHIDDVFKQQHDTWQVVLVVIGLSE